MKETVKANSEGNEMKEQEEKVTPKEEEQIEKKQKFQKAKGRAKKVKKEVENI